MPIRAALAAILISVSTSVAQCELALKVKQGKHTASREETPSKRNWKAGISGYLSARCHDFLDAVEMRVGLGGYFILQPIGWKPLDMDDKWMLAVGSVLPQVDIEGTELAHIALGYGARRTWGIGRGVVGPLDQTIAGIPITNISLLRDGAGILSLVCHYYADSGIRHEHGCCLIPLVFSVVGHGSIGLTESEPARLADLGVGITLCPVPVAFSLGFSPGRAVHFLIGLMGLDLAGGDVRKRGE